MVIKVSNVISNGQLLRLKKKKLNKHKNTQPAVNINEAKVDCLCGAERKELGHMLSCLLAFQKQCCKNDHLRLQMVSTGHDLQVVCTIPSPKSGWCRRVGPFSNSHSFLQQCLEIPGLFLLSKTKPISIQMTRIRYFNPKKKKKGWSRNTE